MVVTALSPGLPALVPLALLTVLILAMNAFELYWVTTERPLILLKIGSGVVGD